VLSGRQDLTFEGNGATFVQQTSGTRNRSFWKMINCDTVTLRGFDLVGANPAAGTGDAAYQSAYEGQHGFEVASSRNVLIERNQISDIYGDFLYVGNEAGPWADTVRFADNTCLRNGRQGASVVGGTNVTIENNSFTGIRRSLLDIEPNSSDGGATHVSYRGNSANAVRLSFMACKGAAGTVGDVTLENNTLYSATLFAEVDPPSPTRRGPFLIQNNTTDTQTGSAAQWVLKFTSCDGVVVAGNTQPMQAGRNMYLCRFVDCTSYTASGNTIVNGVGQFFDT
jgi:Right handed beta helix region